MDTVTVRGAEAGVVPLVTWQGTGGPGYRANSLRDLERASPSGERS